VFLRPSPQTRPECSHPVESKTDLEERRGKTTEVADVTQTPFSETIQDFRVTGPGPRNDRVKPSHCCFENH